MTSSVCRKCRSCTRYVEKVTWIVEKGASGGTMGAQIDVAALPSTLFLAGLETLVRASDDPFSTSLVVGKRVAKPVLLYLSSAEEKAESEEDDAYNILRMAAVTHAHHTAIRVLYVRHVDGAVLNLLRTLGIASVPMCLAVDGENVQKAIEVRRASRGTGGSPTVPIHRFPDGVRGDHVISADTPLDQLVVIVKSLGQRFDRFLQSQVDMVAPTAEQAPDASSTTTSLEQRLEAETKASRVRLFIKGTRTAPFCKFTKMLLRLLDEHGIVEFTTFNILADDDVRQGLKTYSEWPTFPQIYVDGEFIGGLDVLRTGLQAEPLDDEVQQLLTLGKVGGGGAEPYTGTEAAEADAADAADAGGRLST